MTLPLQPVIIGVRLDRWLQANGSNGTARATPFNWFKIQDQPRGSEQATMIIQHAIKVTIARTNIKLATEKLDKCYGLRHEIVWHLFHRLIWWHPDQVVSFQSVVPFKNYCENTIVGFLPSTNNELKILPYYSGRYSSRMTVETAKIA